MPLKALLINCTLKGGDEQSNTEALLQEVVHVMQGRGVECTMLRAVDHDVKPGVTSDEGQGDAWPAIKRQVLDSNILVIGTPIWLGKLSSVAQRVMERLDGLLSETNEKGQLPLYNKVAGCIVTGNEDGAQHTSGMILHDLMQIGATIPPNVNCYWVGEAGPGPSYIEQGTKSEYTKKLVQYCAHNLVHFAEMLQRTPIPTQGNAPGSEKP